MRHRFYTLCAGLIATTVITLALSGCSDDKTTNSGTPGGISVTDDQTAMQQEVNASADSSVVFLANAFESRASLGVGGNIDPVFYTPIDSDSDVVVTVYDTANGWHQIVVTRIATAYNFSWRDSVQFRNANGDFQRQGGTATAMTYHHRFNRSSLDTTNEYYNRSGVWQYEITGLQTDQATINGSTTISTQTKYQDDADSTIWRSYAFSATATNVTVNRTGGAWSVICPTSGTINGTMTTTYKRGSADMVTRQWDVTIEFNDGTAHVTVATSRKNWETDRNICTVIN